MNAVDDTRPVGVGIAGLGRAGWGLHAETLALLPDHYAVIAVSDPLPPRRQEAEQRFSCAAHEDTTTLLDDPGVELVVVATPSHTHADTAVRALEAGKHVLVEKPFATSLADAERMTAAARANGRTVMGSQNLRFSAEFLTVQEVIASGKLGRIIQISMAWHSFRRRWDWQTLAEYGGGALNNDGSHIIDQAMQLFGDQEPHVVCHMQQTPLNLGDTEDHVKVILSGPGAPLIDIEFTSACAYPRDQWLVMGTAGTLTGGHGRFRWRWVDPDLVEPRVVEREPSPDRSYDREELPWNEETRDCSSETYQMSMQRMYRHIHRRLRRDGPAVLTAESVCAQLSVIERCRRVNHHTAEADR